MERLFRIRCSQIGKIMSNSKVKGELSQTCKSYLMEWYADDNEQISSKYMDKGIEVEDNLIDFMAAELGYGMAEKNREGASDEFMTGECDVNLHDCIVDVKASWNRKTLHQQVIDGIDKDYEYQLQGYCHLYNKPKGILFFGLMNTPETNFSNEIIYEDMPPEQRWIAYEIKANNEVIEAIKQRVIKCREWLFEYDKLIKSKLGKIN